MKKVIFFLIITGFTLSQSIAQNDTIASYFSRNIKSENLKKYLTVLASDELEGRETGTAGHIKTINYLSEFYQEQGLDKDKENYFQTYKISLLGPKGMDLSIGKNKYEFMKDYYYFPGFDDIKIKSKNIQFCGYGIVDTSKNYDDYKNKEVKQKIIVILDGEPIEQDGKFMLTGTKEASLWSSNRRLKLEQAKKRGAEALVVVVENIEEKITKYRHNIEKPQATIEKPNEEKKSTTDKRIPVVYISTEMASQLFDENAIKQWKLNPEIKPTFSGKQMLLTLKRTPTYQSAENVIALVKGSEKPEEVVVLSAHLDHLGKHGDKIYYGADDDGSGTSAIMELARVFKLAEKNGYRPKRSVMFINFSGEEKGLLGSQYYSENPVIPLKNTVANLNIDMIGRLDKDHENNPNYTYIIGSDKLSSELHSINEEANKKHVKIELDYTYNRPNDPNRFYYRSDHYNFAKHNIPVIFYFTGVHEDYHQPTDTVDKIDFNKMEKISKLVFHTAWELANRKEKIIVDKVNDMPPSR